MKERWAQELIFAEEGLFEISEKNPWKITSYNMVQQASLKLNLIHSLLIMSLIACKFVRRAHCAYECVTIQVVYCYICVRNVNAMIEC